MKEQETSLATVNVQSMDGLGERGGEAGQRRDRAGHKPSPTTPVDLEVCVSSRPALLSRSRDGPQPTASGLRYRLLDMKKKKKKKKKKKIGGRNFAIPNKYPLRALLPYQRAGGEISLSARCHWPCSPA